MDSEKMAATSTVEEADGHGDKEEEKGAAKPHWALEEPVPTTHEDVWVALRVVRTRVPRRSLAPADGRGSSSSNNAGTRSRSRSRSRSPSKGSASSNSTHLFAPRTQQLLGDMLLPQCEVLLQWRPPTRKFGGHGKRSQAQFWVSMRRLLGRGEDGAIEAQRSLSKFVSSSPMTSKATGETWAAACTAELEASLRAQVPAKDEHKTGISADRALLLLREYVARLEAKGRQHSNGDAQQQQQQQQQQRQAAGNAHNEDEDNRQLLLDEFFASAPREVFAEINAWRRSEAERLDRQEVVDLRAEAEGLGIRSAGRKSELKRTLLQAGLLRKRGDFQRMIEQRKWEEQYRIISDLPIGGSPDTINVINLDQDGDYGGGGGVVFVFSMGIQLEVWILDRYSETPAVRSFHAFSEELRSISDVSLCRHDDGTLYVYYSQATRILACSIDVAQGRFGPTIELCSFVEPNRVKSFDVCREGRHVVAGIHRDYRCFVAELELAFDGSAAESEISRSLKQLHLGDVVTAARFFQTTDRLWQVVFSPAREGEYVLVHRDAVGGVYLYDFGAEVARHKVCDAGGGVGNVTFSPDGDSIYVAVRGVVFCHRLLEADGDGNVGEKVAHYTFDDADMAIRGFGQVSDNARVFVQIGDEIGVFYAGDPEYQPKPLYRIVPAIPGDAPHGDNKLTLLPSIGAKDFVAVVSREHLLIVGTTEFGSMTKGL
jgi:hypothetical protein